jgi:hypothetical protein
MQDAPGLVRALGATLAGWDRAEAQREALQRSAEQGVELVEAAVGRSYPQRAWPGKHAPVMPDS